MSFEIPATPDPEEITKNEEEQVPSDVESKEDSVEAPAEGKIFTPEEQKNKVEREMDKVFHPQTQELEQDETTAKEDNPSFIGKKFEQIKRAAKEFLTPEKYVTEAIPWIGELELPKGKISWIAEVRRHSEKLEDDNPGRKTAFDLMKLHLMAQRELKLDQFSHRREYLQKETEKEADEIIGYILRSFKGGKGFYDDILEPSIRRLKTARTPDEKLVAISRYINVVHYGSSPAGMNIFGGYPKYEWGGDAKHWRGRDVENFFSTLNDL